MYADFKQIYLLTYMLVYLNVPCSGKLYNYKGFDTFTHHRTYHRKYGTDRRGIDQRLKEKLRRGQVQGTIKDPRNFLLS